MSIHLSSRIGLILTTFLIIEISVIFAVKPTSSSSQQNFPSMIFGVSDPYLIAKATAFQTSQLAAMKAIGITSVRVEANWSWIQPESSRSFDWAQLDQEVNSIRSAGMSVDLLIDGCPKWAASPDAANSTSPDPVSSAQFAAWAGDVASRYAHKGVKYFEIWNEPNGSQVCQPKANAAVYTADLVAAYAAIKKVDPSAFVVSGGLAPEPSNGIDISPITFLKEMYADGAKGSFDALGYHPYSFPASPYTYEPWSAWSQMNQTKPSIRSIMESNGDSEVPIWITEYGAPSSGEYGIGSKAQSIELNQAISYAKRVTWIGAFYIYTWQDTAGGPAIDNGFGLLTESGIRKPAYSTVKDLLRQ
jgi:polysaccharide biosynthesis protein PslG